MLLTGLPMVNICPGGQASPGSGSEVSRLLPAKKPAAPCRTSAGARQSSIAGTDLPLWGLEIDADEASQRFRASSAADGGQARATCRRSCLAPDGLLVWHQLCPGLHAASGTASQRVARRAVSLQPAHTRCEPLPQPGLSWRLGRA